MAHWDDGQSFSVQNTQSDLDFRAGSGDGAVTSSNLDIYLKLYLSLVAIIGLISLIWESYRNYLLFHTLAEFFAIIVSVYIFTISFSSIKLSKNYFFHFIGVAYLHVAILDMIHTLSYGDLNVLYAGNVDIPTQFWIAARLLESVCLLIAPLYLNYGPFGYLMAWIGIGLATAGLILSILVFNIFPSCLILGEGLTPFKKNMEYVICVVLVCSGIHLYIRRKSRFLIKRQRRLMFASLFLTIIAELAFTLYISVSGLANLIGHISKLLSFLVLYFLVNRGTIKVTISLLFANLERKSTVASRQASLLKKLLYTAPTPLLMLDADTLTYPLIASQFMTQRFGSCDGLGPDVTISQLEELDEDESTELSPQMDEHDHDIFLEVEDKVPLMATLYVMSRALIREIEQILRAFVYIFFPFSSHDDMKGSDIRPARPPKNYVAIKPRIGDDVLESLFGAQAAQIKNALRKVRSDMIYDIRTKMRTVDNNFLTITWNCSQISHYVKIRGHLSPVKAILMLGSDVTDLDQSLQARTEELQRANIDLNQGKKQVEQANKLQGFILRLLSHEIRTPLQGLIGFVAMMEQKVKELNAVDGLPDLPVSPRVHRRDVDDDQTMSSGVSEIRSERDPMATPAGAAHFFQQLSKTGMGGSIGTSDLSSMDEGPSSMQHYMQLVHVSADRIAKTLSSVLDITGLQGVSARKMDLKDLDAQALTHKVCQEHRPTSAAVKFKYEEKNATPIIAYAESESLEKVLMHLIVNALKFTQKGEVRVSVQYVPKWKGYEPSGSLLRCAQDGTITTVKADDAGWYTSQSIFGKKCDLGYVEIHVEDTGVGIGKDSMELMFEGFMQESLGWRRSFEGLGLGLPIARRLLQLMGGFITVESKKDVGSAVRVLVPAGKEQAVAVTPQSIAPKRTARSKPLSKGRVPSILAVEDNVVSMRLLCAFLRGKVDNLGKAASGEEALEMAKSHPYDIILMDIDLGAGLNGMEVGKLLLASDDKFAVDGRESEMTIGQHYKKAAIVACTAHALPGQREMFLAEGFDYYLAKPFSREALHSAIAQLYNKDLA